MITITGKYGIRATVLAHSITKLGKTLITWEIEYPRLILAELNTHRQLSRNSYSSRAVPFFKMLDQLNAEPVRFGEANKGMQDKGEDYDAPVYLEVDEPYDESGILSSRVKKPFGPRSAWSYAKNLVTEVAKAYFEAGYHKQIYNRLLEAFQMQKSVVSATETDNFFWLRDDEAADPTLHELARVMREAMSQSTPELLQAGEWHLPYVDSVRMPDGQKEYFIVVEEDTVKLTVDEAIKVSCARCAAVSYRNEGYGVEKSVEVYERLVGDSRKHASAFEHCATPMKDRFVDLYADTGALRSPSINVAIAPASWEPGISHMDRNMNLWSGNFQGWIQYRKLIKGECYATEQ